MKRLLLLGAFAGAGLTTIPQLICGLGGQAAAPPGADRGGVHAQANDDGTGAQAVGRNGRGGRDRVQAAAGTTSRDSAFGGTSLNAGGNGGNAGTNSAGGSCSNQGLQLSGDADGDVQDNPDADGVANADIAPRCEPGLGVDVDGSGGMSH